MSSNQQFQLAWKLMKGLYNKDIDKKGGIPARVNLIKKQIETAKKFGTIKLTIIGDSNAENLATYTNMSKFDPIGLSINIAVSGTRADEWVSFFQTKNGLLIYKEIVQTKVLWNIGGNHILQSKVDILENSLNEIHDIFPLSYNCLIPPIWSKFLEFNQILINTHQQVLLCNEMIKKIWKEKTIDTFTPFMNWERNEPYVMAHKDLVHFSELGDSVRIPLIIMKLKTN